MTVSSVELPPGVILMSMSQVQAWLDCQRKWMFSYLFEKQSDHVSTSLATGIIGHEILAVYYQALKDGHSKFEAEQLAMKKLTEYFTAGKTDTEILAKVHGLVSRYISNDSLASLKILEVESDFFIPINDLFWFGARIDLLVEDTRGRLRLIDHKFMYDFATPDSLLMNSQMPKYVAALRVNGKPVVEAYLNMFRTRFKSHLLSGKPDEDLFQRSPVKITEEKIQSNLDYQITASMRIIERRSLPILEAVHECIPIQNPMMCSWCPFKEPCMKMNEGMSAVAALGSGYVPKTSGFDIVTTKELID